MTPATIHDLLAEASPGPWRYEAGGGHAYNSLVASDSVQTNGWPERRSGISNVSYSDRLCENLGDTELPGPKANAALMAHARAMAEALARLAEPLPWPANREALRLSNIARECLDKIVKEWKP